ncbi:MAG: hypothetical protein QW303_01945 [Nitrososphaerota archaeon]
MERFRQDNIIHWIFDKIFDQLTLEGREIYTSPFSSISEKTFYSHFIHELIHKLTMKRVDYVKSYLESRCFQEKFLFDKLKKKIHVYVLLHDLEKVKILVSRGYKIDAEALKLVVLNNYHDLLTYISNGQAIKLDRELLVYCAEFGYDDMYFYLREKGLMPNISIYNKASVGTSVNIVRDVSKYIGISSKILSNAFQTNQTEVILFLINVALEERVKISPNLAAYPILNANFRLMEELENRNLVDWHPELYYAAILSGSMEIIKYVESKLPNIHENGFLDTSRTRKGQNSHLLEDMIYERGGKKYFSHCMNYAVQSRSIEVVKYIYEKGYGITPSNILTAIKQGTMEILKFLLEKYQKKLPSYFIHYFGINSYLANKLEVAKMLVEGGHLSPNINDFSNHKKESIHLRLIMQSNQISEINAADVDYLMKYHIFFVPTKNATINYKLLTTIRLYLHLNIDEELTHIYNSNLNDVDLQLSVDCLFLFGNILQIKKFYPMIRSKTVPSKQIIMEIMCYYQLNKLCYLVSHNLLNKETIDFLYPVAIALGDPHLISLFGKIAPPMEPEKQLKYILQSGRREMVDEWLQKHSNIISDKSLAKSLILMDDVDFIKKFNLKNLSMDELVDFAEESDVREVAEYLRKLDLPEKKFDSQKIT